MNCSRKRFITIDDVKNVFWCFAICLSYTKQFTCLIETTRLFLRKHLFLFLFHSDLHALLPKIHLFIQTVWKVSKIWHAIYFLDQICHECSFHTSSSHPQSWRYYFSRYYVKEMFFIRTPCTCVFLRSFHILKFIRCTPVVEDLFNFATFDRHDCALRFLSGMFPDQACVLRLLYLSSFSFKATLALK